MSAPEKGTRFSEDMNMAVGIRPPDPTISEVVDELERFINMMAETAGMAEKRLQPILKRSAMSADEFIGADSEESVMSGLSMRLQRLTRQVLAIRDDLQQTVDRVDL